MNAPAPADFGGRDSGLSGLLRDVLDSGYGPPARSPAAPARAGGPGWRVVAMVAILLAGLLAAITYRQVVAEQPQRAQVRADLEAQIHQRQAETTTLQQQVQRLSDEVTQLRDRQLSDPAEVRRLRESEAIAGLRRVHGDGVVVTVSDAPAELDPVTGEPAFAAESRILYRDLQQLANALWAAGAEAVAINGQRLTATSAIRSASGAILVDHQPVVGPYELAAVGPPQLAQRFADSQAVALMRLLGEEYGIGYQLRREQELSLPPASAPALRHAGPATGQG